VKTLLECGFSGWPGLLRFAVFRISKAFLIEFITRSRLGCLAVEMIHRAS
jgi:hypothetical protein